MRRRILFAAVLAAVSFAAPAGAADRFDVLDTTVSGHLQPVRGSDGRQHLVYQLRLHNLSTSHAITVESVTVRDAKTKRPVETISGDGLRADMTLGDAFANEPTTTLGPGQAGVVYLDPSFPSLRSVPARLQHVIRVSPAPGSDPATFAARFGTEVVGPAVHVDRRPPIALASPMRGTGFLALNGCCDSPSHVRTILSVGGLARSAERFAIDWVQVDRQDRLSTGDGTRNEEYFIYGEPIRAVAAGRVLVATDGAPDTPPLQRTSATVTPGLAAGNHVIHTLGDGRYAMYAHIKPGTVRVKRGQRVRKGQIIGLVGSSGNSDAPHLHFQVTDKPSPLGAEGLPYVFKRFTLEGQVGQDDVFRWLPSPQVQRDALPLDRAIVAMR